MQEKPKITLELIYASLQTMQFEIAGLKQDISGMKFEINEIRIDQIRTNKQYQQIDDRMSGIESDIKEIYDRLVVLEERNRIPSCTKI